MHALLKMLPLPALYEPLYESPYLLIPSHPAYKHRHSEIESRRQ
jgi:hypothetical protein